MNVYMISVVYYNIPDNNNMGTSRHNSTKPRGFRLSPPPLHLPDPGNDSPPLIFMGIEHPMYIHYYYYYTLLHNNAEAINVGLTATIISLHQTQPPTTLRRHHRRRPVATRTILLLYRGMAMRYSRSVSMCDSKRPPTKS